MLIPILTALSTTLVVSGTAQQLIADLRHVDTAYASYARQVKAVESAALEARKPSVWGGARAAWHLSRLLAWARRNAPAPEALPRRAAEVGLVLHVTPDELRTYDSRALAWATLFLAALCAWVVALPSWFVGDAAGIVGLVVSVLAMAAPFVIQWLRGS